MSAIEAILSFDGKHVDQLKAVVSSGIDDDEWVDVASFFDHGEARYQTASTWLVKTALERSQAVPSTVMQRLFKAVRVFGFWEAKLHFLQSLQFINVPATERQELLKTLSGFEGDTKTLVSVWALDAYTRLAASEPALTDNCISKLELALNHNSASMRARARNLLKEFPQLAR